MTLNKPKGIFFDWDGTLVDSVAPLELAHRHVMAHFGLEQPPEGTAWFYEFFGKPRHLVYLGIYGEELADTAREMYDEYFPTMHCEAIAPMAEAEDLLKTIVSSGVPAGIVTNKKPSFVKPEIEHLGWDKYFSAVVGCNDAGRDKPHADPLILALSLAKVGDVDPSEIWFVGDTPADHGCALNYGASFIYTDYEGVPVQHEFNPKPAAVVKNCTELSDLLLQYVSN